MLVYTPTITSRLQYIADFCGKEITGRSFELTTDKESYLISDAEKINYSPERISNSDFWVKPHSLLFEDTIKEQIVQCFPINGQKGFFKTEGDFGIMVIANKMPARYVLLVWTGDEMKIEMPSVFKRAGAAALQRGGWFANNKTIVIIGAAALLLILFLLLKLKNKKQ